MNQKLFNAPDIEIGYLQIQHGKKSQLLLHHYLGKETCFLSRCFLFVEIQQGNIVPFEVIHSEAINLFSTKVELLFQEDIFREQKPSKKMVYLDEISIHQYAADDSILKIRNYAVYHQEKFIGHIVDELELTKNKQTRLFVLQYEKETIHLPFEHKMIEHIHVKEKMIFLRS